MEKLGWYFNAKAQNSYYIEEAWEDGARKIGYEASCG